MGINYQKFRFASAPRTGTAYFINAAEQAGLGPGAKPAVHTPWPADQNGLSLTTVRHPCRWLASYWKSIYPGSVGVNAVDQFRLCSHVAEDGTITMGNLPFYLFVDAYLIKRAGKIGEMFDAYNANIVHRIEDAPWCFIEFFESIGVPKSKYDSLRNAGPINTSKDKPEWDKAQWNAVCDAECRFMERYEY